VALVDPHYQAAGNAPSKTFNGAMQDFLTQSTTRADIERFLKDYADSANKEIGPDLDASARVAQLFVSLVDRVLPSSTTQLKQIWDSNHELLALVSTSLSKLSAATPHSAHLAAVPVEEEEELQAVLPLEATATLPEPPNVPAPALEAILADDEVAGDGWQLDDDDSLL